MQITLVIMLIWGYSVRALVPLLERRLLVVQPLVKSEKQSDAGIYTAANGVTGLRLLFYFPTLYHLMRAINNPGRARWLLPLAGVILATDMLDGWIARRYKQTSLFGKFLDPTADKLESIPSLVCMAYVLSFRASPVLLVFIAIITVLRVAPDSFSTVIYWVQWRRGEIRGANNSGKAKTWAELIGLFLGYSWLAFKCPGGANMSAAWILLGCSIAIVTSFSSLRSKLAQM